MSSILDQTRALIDVAGGQVYRGSVHEPRLVELRRRLDEPLRVAISGRVKAGKSTLLNALIADRLAPTDAGECTRIVTWYADGHTYQVVAEPVAAPPRQLRFDRDEKGLKVDLQGMSPDEIARLLVTWPSQGLRVATLIDTPGIGSLSEEVARRAWDLLTPQDDADTAADAVLYLLRHLHSNDIDFLRAFHDTSAAQPTPVNAIGVLSRADEVGAGRLDAMASARAVAARMAADPTVRRLVQTVVPVAGLLAETGATLTEAEFAQLRSIAALDKAVLDTLLLTVDRFVTSHPELELSQTDRQRLLDRFGLFGIRISLPMIKHKVAATAPDLATQLTTRSGVNELRTVLETLFLQRRDVLKSRAALLALEALAYAHPAPGSDRIVAETERITASAHALRELQVLAAIRSGWVTGKDEVVAEAERIVGGEGVDLRQRLALDPDADRDQVVASAGATLERWQRRAENPLTGHQLAAVSRVVIQSCEGMLGELHGWGR